MSYGISKQIGQSLVDHEKRLASVLHPSYTGNAKQFIARALHYIKSKQGERGDVSGCTPMSIVKSVVTAAELGIAVDGTLGSAYLIPYKEKCTLIIGYRGMIDIAKRVAGIQITADVVRENDVFEFEQGTKPFLIHKYGWDRGNVKGYYALAKMPNSEADIFIIMSAVEVDAIRMKSPGRNSGPWKDHPEEMGKKTAVRRLFKQLPFSQEQLSAVIGHDDKTDGIAVETEVVKEADTGTQAERMAKELDVETVDTGLTDDEKAQIEANEAKGE